MAEDMLPLLGHNIEDDNEESDSSSDLAGDNEDEKAENDAMSKKCMKYKGNAAGDGRHANVIFDRSLPGTHSYLGCDLVELRGRTVYDEEAVITLPLLPLPGVVLLPGQVIPLHLFQQQLVAAVRRLADTDKTFGVVAYSTEGEDHSPSLAQIGCTAEIFSMKDETEESTGISTLRAKARGRQRFEVKDMHRDITGILMAKVQILPELFVPRCLRDVCPTSHNKFCSSPAEQDTVVKTALDRHGNAFASVTLMVNKQVDRFTCAYFTWWPPWVYKMYDIELLKSRVKEEICSWNENLQTVLLPADATELSYWVAQNLPLDNALRIFLLGINCTVQRLRAEIKIMQKYGVLCCASCLEQIARKEHVFSMAEEGFLGAYVNPGGHVHETLSVYEATNLTLIGRPTTEHSWFPGYAWTIAQCHSCANHMGWCFTAVKKSLSPKKFWGLCRLSLVPGLNTKIDDEA